jgi:GntR family transcriptional repressor for pyruvate dehydrogenase complex
MSPEQPLESLAVWSGSLLEPLETRNSGELIAERLVTAIALGQFVRGQRLPPERELAAALRVSRTSVREAIAKLAATGYVRVRRGRTGGAFVTGDCDPEFAAIIRRTLLPDWDRLRSLLDFRSSAEAEIARLAADRATPPERETIRTAAERYVAAGSDRAASRATDAALHRAIAAATHNPFWQQLSLQLRAEVTFGLDTEPFSAELRRRAEHQHPALADAIARGEAEQAALLAQEHFSVNDELIDRVLADAANDARRDPGPSGEASA